MIAIQHDSEFFLSNGIHIDEIEDLADVHGCRIFQRGDFAECRPVFPRDVVLLEDSNQLLPEFSIKNGTIRCEWFQSIPFNGVMTGGNLQAPGTLVMLDQDAAARSRADSGIKDFSTCGDQSRNYGVMQHRAGEAAIPSDDDAPATEHGSEGGGELRDVNRIQAISDHASEPGNAENSSSHGEFL